MSRSSFNACYAGPSSRRRPKSSRCVTPHAWLERTYDFVPRVGLEPIREVVVNDSEGIAERLDAAVQHHVDTRVDPWTQGREPLSPGQFRTSLPLEVPPQVPSDRAESLLEGPW